MFSIHSKNVQIVWFHTKSPFCKFYLWQMKFPDVLILPITTSIASHFLLEIIKQKTFFLLRTNGNLKYIFIKFPYFYRSYGKSLYLYTTRNKHYIFSGKNSSFLYFLIQYSKFLALWLQLKCYSSKYQILLFNEIDIFIN